MQRKIKLPNSDRMVTYHYKPIRDIYSAISYSFKLFPMVLHKDGSPWILACLYLMDRLEGDIQPSFETYKSIASDLGAYRAWLDENLNIPNLMFDFPKFKLARATYRFAAYLRQRVMNKPSEASTSERRMNAIVNFYRWLADKQYFIPDNPPWDEKSLSLKVADRYGLSIQKQIRTTDLNPKIPKAAHTFDKFIEDGGKLKPLTEMEQRWIYDGLNTLGNIEIKLILLIMLLTGARIQTACTFLIGHFLDPNPRLTTSIKGLGKVFKLAAGPSTGIDTKNNKQGILMIPMKLYDALHRYAVSPRVKRRSAKTKLGWESTQYLFLTQQGSPYYESRKDIQEPDPDFNRHHFKKGETIRQFIRDRLIPHIQLKHSKGFSFRDHDLRATFGMNVECRLAILVHEGKLTKDQARQILAALLWHSSPSITDRYLTYRIQHEEVFNAVNDYGDQLMAWIQNDDGEL